MTATAEIITATNTTIENFKAGHANAAVIAADHGLTGFPAEFIAGYIDVLAAYTHSVPRYEGHISSTDDMIRSSERTKASVKAARFGARGQFAQANKCSGRVAAFDYLLSR